jgi:hypothetical protein
VRKPIPDARDSGYPVGAIACRPKTLSQGRDLDGKIAFLHRNARPRGIEKLRFGHDSTWFFQQCVKNRKPSMPDRKGRAIRSYRTTAHVEYEGAKDKSPHQHKCSIALLEVAPRLRFGRLSELFATVS